jgi:ATP-dependent exoDNAse (exonuclease V) alpha subunit
MQIENDYDKEVYNGDIGYIDDVDPEASELTASFDGRSVTYDFRELDTLVPAYAATIHKSRCSEYPAVVIPVMTQHVDETSMVDVMLMQALMKAVPDKAALFEYQATWNGMPYFAQ